MLPFPASALHVAGVLVLWVKAQCSGSGSCIHFRYCRQRQKNRALFFSEMWHLLVPLKFLLLWDVYMQSDMPLV